MAWGDAARHDSDAFRGSIRVTEEPSVDAFATIHRGLEESTTGMVGPAQLRPLVALLEDASGVAVGGLWGRTAYSWLTIEMLFVPVSLRRHGLGSRLIGAAEAEARQRSCFAAQVCTFNFQAPDFYRRLGYSVFAVQPDMPPGHSTSFLRKLLVAALHALGGGGRNQS